MHLHCSNLAFRSTFVLQVDTYVRAPPSGSCCCYSYTQPTRLNLNFPRHLQPPQKKRKKREEKAQNEAYFTILKVGNNYNPGFTEKHNTCRHHTHAHTMQRCRVIQRNIIRETINSLSPKSVTFALFSYIQLFTSTNLGN